MSTYAGLQEWKEKLSSSQYSILRQAGTERPFGSPLNKEKRAGTALGLKSPEQLSHHKCPITHTACYVYSTAKHLLETNPVCYVPRLESVALLARTMTLSPQ